MLSKTLCIRKPNVNRPWHRKQLDENKNLTYYDLERIEQVINSYLGFCVHHQSYQIRKENIINLGDNFWKYFYVKGHYESIRIRPDYRIF